MNGITSCRYSIKFEKPATSSWVETCAWYSKFITAMLQEIKSHDPFALMMPWYDEQAADDVSDPNDAPKTKDTIQIYLHRAKFTQDKSGIWTEVRLASKFNPDTLADSARAWFKDQNGYIYRKTLQSPETAKIGWLLWSARAMNEKILEEHLSFVAEFPISIRWRKIATGDWKEKTRYEALHIEVNRENARAAKTLFADTYKRGATSFPLGINLFLSSI